MLKEQTGTFLNQTFSKKDRAIKRAEDCKKYIMDIETSTRELVQDVVSLAGEEDKLAIKYNLCMEQLAAYEAAQTS